MSEENEARSCPRCGADRTVRMTTRPRWRCKACRYQFSDTARTLLHARKMPLEKYRAAFDYFKTGMSAAEVARTVGCNYRTAWRLRTLAIEEAIGGNA